jgi:hypothetical protein
VTSCVLLRARVLFVLREVKGQRSCRVKVLKQYRLTVEAYVYGLMEGEDLAHIDLSRAEENASTSFEDLYIC